MNHRGLCISLLSAVAFLHTPAPVRGSLPQVIRVNVEMVSLPVVVTTREGTRVLDLAKDDFEVYEDGVLQEIAGFATTEEPISMLLALDTSGSLESQLASIQNEAIRFVNLLHPDDSVAILSFAEDVKLLEDWSIDRRRNARGIKETRHGTCTKLFEAVWLSCEEVLKPVRERKALVLFTDGVDTASHKANREETVRLAQEAGAAIYPIYFTARMPLGSQPKRSPQIMLPPAIPSGSAGGCMPTLSMFGSGRKYLTELADITGGKVVDAKRMPDLGPAFEEIAKELSSQYSLGYYPASPKHDGKFRRIEVKVKKPDLTVRTKKGYYSPTAEKKK